MDVRFVFPKTWAYLRVSEFAWSAEKHKGKDGTHVRISAMKPNMVGKKRVRRGYAGLLGGALDRLE